jgi:hypothetical protein
VGNDKLNTWKKSAFSLSYLSMQCSPLTTEEQITIYNLLASAPPMRPANPLMQHVLAQPNADERTVTILTKWAQSLRDQEAVAAGKAFLNQKQAGMITPLLPRDIARFAMPFMSSEAIAIIRSLSRGGRATYTLVDLFEKLLREDALIPHRRSLKLTRVGRMLVDADRDPAKQNLFQQLFTRFFSIATCGQQKDFAYFKFTALLGGKSGNAFWGDHWPNRMEMYAIDQLPFFTQLVEAKKARGVTLVVEQLSFKYRVFDRKNMDIKKFLALNFEAHNFALGDNSVELPRVVEFLLACQCLHSVKSLKIDFIHCEPAQIIPEIKKLFSKFPKLESIFQTKLWNHGDVPPATTATYLRTDFAS